MDVGAEGAILRWVEELRELLRCVEEVRELWHDGCRRRGAISRWM